MPKLPSYHSHSTALDSQPKQCTTKFTAAFSMNTSTSTKSITCCLLCSYGQHWLTLNFQSLAYMTHGNYQHLVSSSPYLAALVFPVYAQVKLAIGNYLLLNCQLAISLINFTLFYLLIYVCVYDRLVRYITQIVRYFYSTIQMCVGVIILELCVEMESPQCYIIFEIYLTISEWKYMH